MEKEIDLIKIFGDMSEDDRQKIMNYFKEVSKLKEENEYLKRELDKRIAEEKVCRCVEPIHGNDPILMLSEIRDTLRRLEHEHKMKEIDQRYTEWENKKKNAEWEMESAQAQKAHLQSEYWNRG